MNAKRSDIAARLLEWYDANARALPWRALPGEITDPYRVWLSEVMLQQTTVAAVRPRFAAWVARWPDVESLARADEAEVMSAWAGLGYYARARNLVRAARLAAERGGFPRTEAGLRELPGLGAYTAAAIAAIAFGERAVVVDANVERVVARLFAIRGKGAGVRAATDSITPEARAGDFAQAMMDLGATICTPRSPRCLLCPLRENCAGFASGEPEAFPTRKEKPAKPRRYGTIFWLERPISPSPSGVSGRSVPRTDLKLPGAVSPETGLGWGLSTHGGACGTPPPPAPPLKGRGAEILLVRRPANGLLGGMRALPTGPWADAPPGLAGAPGDADWRLLDTGVTHVFTHFRLELALAVGAALAHSAADGDYWPVARLGDAGLPTVFAKAADAIGRAR